MAANITIRDIPTKVRDELAARAAAQGRSMQEYLRTALERFTARPTQVFQTRHTPLEGGLPMLGVA